MQRAVGHCSYMPCLRALTDLTEQACVWRQNLRTQALRSFSRRLPDMFYRVVQSNRTVVQSNWTCPVRLNIFMYSFYYPSTYCILFILSSRCIYIFIVLFLSPEIPGMLCVICMWHNENYTSGKVIIIIGMTIS